MVNTRVHKSSLDPAKNTQTVRQVKGPSAMTLVLAEVAFL